MATILLFFSAAGETNTLNTNVQWTCLLIDPHPSSINFQSVGQDPATVTTLDPVDSSGNPVTTSYNINISWQNSTGNTNNFSGCATSPNLPSYGTWNSGNCGAGLVRFDLVPSSAISSGSTSTLENETLTGFLYPSTNSGDVGPITYSTGTPLNGQGQVTKSYCNPSSSTTYACSMKISNIPSGIAYLRLEGIYGNQSVSITGADSHGNIVDFANSQIVVDSTGKASDVLRRIQVHVPLNVDTDNTPFAIQATGSICKRFTTTGPGDNSLLV